ncbi:hypothetical protein NPIL_261681, partial [Nephila pilipes]
YSMVHLGPHCSEFPNNLQHLRNIPFEYKSLPPYEDGPQKRSAPLATFEFGNNSIRKQACYIKEKRKNRLL